MERRYSNSFRIQPVQQNIAYINGIGRNRFHDWNEFSAKIILNQYVSSLRDYGLNDDKILDELVNNVIPYTKAITNWIMWKNQIEDLIKNIDSWEKDNELSLDEIGYFVNKNQTLDDKLNSDRETINDNLLFLLYIGKAFPQFDQAVLTKKYYELIIDFFQVLNDQYVSKIKNEIDQDFVYDHYSLSTIPNEFEHDEDENQLLDVLSTKAMFAIIESLEIFDYPSLQMNKSEVEKILGLHKEYFKKLLADSQKK